jgi:hypothetical protein
MVIEVSLSLSHPSTDRIVEEVTGEHDYHRLVAAATSTDVVDNANSREVVIVASAIGSIDDGDIDGVPLTIPLECVIVKEGTGHLKFRAIG